MFQSKNIRPHKAPSRLCESRFLQANFHFAGFSIFDSFREPLFCEIVCHHVSKFALNCFCKFEMLQFLAMIFVVVRTDSGEHVSEFDEFVQLSYTQMSENSQNLMGKAKWVAKLLQESTDFHGLGVPGPK